MPAGQVRGFSSSLLMEYSSRIDLTEFNSKIAELKFAVNSIVKGQDEVLELLLTALLADGHVLLEGVPGVAKTLMAKTLSQLIGVDFKRLQFTPDLMPTDVVGTSILNTQTQEFTFPTPRHRSSPSARDQSSRSSYLWMR